MHPVHWFRHLVAAVAALALAACTQDVTAPKSAASPIALNAHVRGPIRDTYLSGGVMGTTTNDGTTITLDRTTTPAILSINDGRVPLDAEAADSMQNLLTRIYNAEQQAKYVQSSGQSGGGINVPPPPDENPCGTQVICSPGGMLSAPIGGASTLSRRGRIATRTTSGRPHLTHPANQPFVVGPAQLGGGLATPLGGATATSVGGPASYDMGYDPLFSCTDISLAIMNEMPAFNGAKTAYLAAVAGNVLNTLTYVKGWPPQFATPANWLNWGRLFGVPIGLEVLKANLEFERTKLGGYAVMFNAQSCLYPDSQPSQVPAANGSGGGGSDVCYEMVYYYIDTGQIFGEEGLGCW